MGPCDAMRFKDSQQQNLFCWRRICGNIWNPGIHNEYILWSQDSLSLQQETDPPQRTVGPVLLAVYDLGMSRHPISFSYQMIAQKLMDKQKLTQKLTHVACSLWLCPLSLTHVRWSQDTNVHISVLQWRRFAWDEQWPNRDNVKAEWMTGIHKLQETCQFGNFQRFQLAIYKCIWS